MLNNSWSEGLAGSVSVRVKAAGFPVERVDGFQSVYNVPVASVLLDSEDADATRTLLKTVRVIKRLVPRQQTRVVGTNTLVLAAAKDLPPR